MDIESFEENGVVVPYCVCGSLDGVEFSCYYENSPSFCVILKALEYFALNSKKSNIDIYVHNLNFDGSLIIDALSKKKVKFKFYARKTNLYSISILYMNKDITFRCSYKLIGLSLKKISDLECIKKTYFPYKFVSKKTLFYRGPLPDISFWDFEYLNKKEISIILNSESVFDLKKRTIDYCINDVRITVSFLTKLLKIVNDELKGATKRAYSAPSLSFKIFFSKYNSLNIEKNLAKAEDSFIRDSYFGGRTEVFGNLFEGEHIKYYDFSGMYAQCMLEDFHYGKFSYSLNGDYTQPGFHTIVYSSNSAYPILPEHDHNGKLIFSNGTKVGRFWFEEIVFFKKNGGEVLKVINSIIYDNCGPVFKDFVEKFTKIRSLGGYNNVFGKLMINSLYGSFGLKPEQEFVYFTFSEDEFNSILKNLNIINFYRINDLFYLLIKKDSKSSNFFLKTNNDNAARNVSYSSAIASKARIKLYSAFQEVMADGGRLLYCDTDSIFAAYDKNDMRGNFNNKKWLGFYEDGVFMSPKSYGLSKNGEEVLKIKGVRVPNNYKKLEEIKNIFYSDNKMVFDNQLIFNRKNFTLRQDYLLKEIWFKDYDKRIFINNKKETLPVLKDFKDNTVI